MSLVESDADPVQKRKIHYPVSSSFGQYLYRYGRVSELPLVYDDLGGFTAWVPYETPKGEETLWLTVIYPPEVMAELQPKLTKIYAMLKIGGDLELSEHLVVDRIDFGEFGNSRPFRIRITNLFNGNSDYYYVKRADASRIYGLELEHVISPKRINFLVRGNTLIEAHIAGVPGPTFVSDYLTRPRINKVRVAKEFVKFGERCFMRLLGDMRGVNYVVEITPDFEDIHYRVRPIDFDQQCYEGSLHVYRAHRFPDNKPVDDLVREHLDRKSILQYRGEERSQMARRAKAERSRFTALFRIMCRDTLAPEDHFVRLRNALAKRYEGRAGSGAFDKCLTMGDLTATHFSLVMDEVTPGRH
jgi:hypothetical protein